MFVGLGADRTLATQRFSVFGGARSLCGSSGRAWREASAREAMRCQGGGEINTQYAGQQARAPGYALRAYPSSARQALGLLGASHAELMLHHHARSAPLCEAPLARREGRERVGAREEVEQRVNAGEVPC